MNGIKTGFSADVFLEVFAAFSLTRFKTAKLAAALTGVLMVSSCTADPEIASDHEVRSTVNRTNDAIVARVEGTIIYDSDVQRAAAAKGLIGPQTNLLPGDAVYRATAEELIDQRLLALDSVRVGASRQEEAQRRLAEARDRILGNWRIETYLAETVNEETIRNLYDAQKSLAGKGEERRVRQIIVADEALATVVLGRLNDEESFEALAQEFSIDESTRARGGDLGWLSRDMMPAPLRGPVFALSVGSRTKPLQSEAGWHIVELLDRRMPAQRSFEETRDDIARFMTFEQIERLMTDLRGRADVDRAYLENDSDSETEPDTGVDSDAGANTGSNSDPQTDIINTDDEQ